MRFMRPFAVISLISALAGQALPGDPAWLSAGAFPSDPEILSPALSSSWFSGPDTSFDLGESWTLDVGGEYRAEYRNDTNFGLPAAPHRYNSFYLGRMLVHADLQTSSGFNLYLEAIDARSTSHDLPPLPAHKNTLDLRNYYVGYNEGDTFIRFGRTDLNYGAQRLVSTNAWTNVPRSFEGIVVQQKMQDGVVDVFVTHPVAVTPHKTDHDDDSLWFSGIYTSWDIGESGSEGVDVYALALNEGSRKLKFAEVSNPAPRGANIYTVGARHWTQDGDLDTEVEFAKQGGKSGGARMRAFALTARAGITFEEEEYSPRVGIDLDYASGDNNPLDTNKGTFNQLFSNWHNYFGFADQVGRQNIVDISPNVSLQVHEMTTLKVAFHNFHLADKHDSAYTAGGGILAADPTFGSGRFVGNELDVTVLHKPEYLGQLDQILMGFSVFSPGHFVKKNGSKKTIKRVYAQFTAHF
jgi:hypothetical protein